MGISDHNNMVVVMKKDCNKVAIEKKEMMKEVYLGNHSKYYFLLFLNKSFYQLYNLHLAKVPYRNQFGYLQVYSITHIFVLK